MGCAQAKDRGSPSERVVEGLKNKVRLLQGEINEIMCIRENESQVYEREMMVFAFKQAEWKRERKRLKGEVKKLRKILEEKQERLRCMEFNNYKYRGHGGNYENEWEIMLGSSSNNDIVMMEEQMNNLRRDETVEKWKQLYFAIKVELDDLIQRTHQGERLGWKVEEEDVLMEELKKELREKEEKLEVLKAKLASMEHQEFKREREMDILRQSLRIMSHKKKATSLARGYSISKY